MIVKLLKAKAIFAAFASVSVTGTAAAAATGALPTPIQHAFSTVARRSQLRSGCVSLIIRTRLDLYEC